MCLIRVGAKLQDIDTAGPMLPIPKLQEYFLCAKKTKITTLFNNFFSSMRVVLLTQELADVLAEEDA